MKIHEKYIKRCIELAKNGLGTTYPNPLVGSVIVHDGKIIGEGWHQKSGEAHAEVHAINSVKDKNLLKNATIYVSLEPCSHFGKTPPCCDLILAHDIPNIVIGIQDPFAKVDGNGIKKLREAGKNVIVGVLENECRELNKRFFTFHEKKRPYIILKWAESADFFLSPESKDQQKPVWITNQYSRQLVHKWRTEEQAILLGTTTVLDDNPSLTARDWLGKNPVRIVLDKSLKTLQQSIISDGKAPTIVLTESQNYPTTSGITFKNVIFDSSLIDQITSILYELNIQSLIVEGGQKTLQSFIDTYLWDEARVFRGTNFFYSGTASPNLKAKAIQTQKILDDQLLIFDNHDKHDNI
ncbi:bifunctional diaminohydroxyphosphoribosylaminopyrimidine deaminase/5-amino-6-(5-phosphoribosylamino)uracil reductase RibD [Flavobacterium sp. NST-5]|uniref:Riboflavin biosynthesis protein RibD n=1 Tax=Flavobacterium ichthyis TaxID=2698827 RepID=A0ABW9Z6Y3_9FLAO|nr:bifunctional diaminohydroxyphosphoribosylaminopyrimidine deaminase/5-amino-6-(5-phosphoribosylamino)uracil reductase RibD [Flavobacterium ichthyis]NBL64456.1 bifunctional diaminohydroxyphosphoribosylaminopyrimidine deaminase/5-amino-6-(5-phosphoribosylamino)uracil reductase RibD [Flavobacterium ichthyis]